MSSYTGHGESGGGNPLVRRRLSSIASSSTESDSLNKRRYEVTLQKFVEFKISAHKRLTLINQNYYLYKKDAEEREVTYKGYIEELEGSIAVSSEHYTRMTFENTRHIAEIERLRIETQRLAAENQEKDGRIYALQTLVSQIGPVADAATGFGGAAAPQPVSGVPSPADDANTAAATTANRDQETLPSYREAVRDGARGHRPRSRRIFGRRGGRVQPNDAQLGEETGGGRCNLM